MLCCLLTFTLFAISQVFARASGMENAFLVFRKIILPGGPLYLDMTNLLYAFLGLGLLMLSDFRDEFFPGRMLAFENRKKSVRYASYILIFYIIIFLGVLDSDTQFIYFKF